MNSFKKGWFTESNGLWPGLAMSMEVEEVLHSSQSQYQSIMVLKTKHQGVALVLDGIIQCTESDEFSYQEMISFLPLCSHRNPQKVLIVGGGDGGVAREVVKFPTVQTVDQVEIDEEVMNVSKKFLPKMASGLLHPKVKLHVEDGFKFLANKTNEYDVIITDSSDPIGPAVPLFQSEYFNLLKNALRPGGIVCCQGGTPWSTMDICRRAVTSCSDNFQTTSFALTSVPTYPDGVIGFVLGTDEPGKQFENPVTKFNEEELETMKLRYYTSDVHTAAFSLPKFVYDGLRK